MRPDRRSSVHLSTASKGEIKVERFFVYAYDMRRSEAEGLWCLLCCKRIMSYHEDALEATWEVTRLINEDITDFDECFAVGSIPLCHDEHNLA